MGFWDKFAEDHEQLNNTPQEHQAHLSHELISGAASFEAVKTYQEHCEREGKPVNHARAMELLAAFAGGAVDRLVETKGLDFVDRERAKRHAEEQVKQYYYETEQMY